MNHTFKGNNSGIMTGNISLTGSKSKKQMSKKTRNQEASARDKPLFGVDDKKLIYNSKRGFHEISLKI